MSFRFKYGCCLANLSAASLDRFDDLVSHARPLSSQRLQVGTSRQISQQSNLVGQLKRTARLHLVFALKQALQAMACL